MPIRQREWVFQKLKKYYDEQNNDSSNNIIDTTKDTKKVLKPGVMPSPTYSTTLPKK